jgi:hypothetical protein
VFTHKFTRQLCPNNSTSNNFANVTSYPAQISSFSRYKTRSFNESYITFPKRLEPQD